MNLPGYLEIAGEKPLLRFLVIGGYAVAAHGHAPATFDVDFLAAAEDREEWRRRVLRRGFQLVSETPFSRNSRHLINPFGTSNFQRRDRIVLFRLEHPGKAKPIRPRIVRQKGKHPVGDIGRAITREKISRAFADFP